MSNAITKKNEIMTPAKALSQAMEFFNPQKIETVDDATVFLSNMNRLSEGANLRFYRAVYVVYSQRLYEDARYLSTKAKQGKVELKCANIVDYCAHCVTPPIGKTQAYNAVAAGAFISPDGMGTCFDDERGRYSFSQLLEIVKSGKGVIFNIEKETGAIFYTMVDAWERAKDAEGHFLYKEDEHGVPRPYYVKGAGEMRLVDVLRLMNAITPQKSVRELAKLLKSNFEVTEFGVRIVDKAEVQETSDEEAASNATSDDVKESAEAPDAQINFTQSEWESIWTAVHNAGYDELANKISKFIRTTIS